MKGHSQPKLEKEMQKSNTYTNGSNKELERHAQRSFTHYDMVSKYEPRY